MPDPSAIPAMMRAAVLYGKEDVRIEQIPVPKPGAGELLLKVEAALTCGTDLKVFKRGYHAAMLKPPCVFGHEMAGVVAALGDGAASNTAGALTSGMRLVVANSAPCGECSYCRRGQENLCDDLKFLNGAYAEYLLVPERFVKRNIYAIPHHVSFAEAAMSEPLACVIHGLNETHVASSDHVAVIGLGPIGLMFVAMLKSNGCRVTGVGRQAARLNLARTLGAEHVIESDSANSWVEAVRKGPPLDAVIEATGQPEIWQHAVDVVRKGGVVNLFGGPPAGTKVALDTNRLHYQQITLTSSFHHRPATFRAALDAIAAGTIKPEQFITGTRPLAELPMLFKEMMQANSAIKTRIVI